MLDVIEQLRSYGEAVEAAVPPAAMGTPRRPRRAVLAAAAVLVVAASAATAVWVLRSQDQDRGPVVETVEEPAAPTGWRSLDPGPLAPREGSALVWTGEELVVWGGARNQSTVDGFTDGAAYDPDAGTWRPMSEAPSSLTGGRAVGVWTGEEVLLWLPSSGWQGAAWNPASDRWRALNPPEAALQPLLYGDAGLIEPVWDGAEMIDVAIGEAYDPATDVWRDLPQRPVAGPVLSTVWTGEEVITLVANRSDASYPAGEGVALSYAPASDTWRALPPTGVGETAAVLAWDGERVVALDYEMAAARYRPGDERWEQLAELPLRFSECGPSLARAGATVLATHCSGDGLLTPGGSWAIAPPPADPASQLVEAGERLFAWWSTDETYNFPDEAVTPAPVSYFQEHVRSAVADDLALERTIPVGTVLLDLSDDARLTATDVIEEGGGLITRLLYELDLPAGPCSLESTYAGLVGPSEFRIRNDAGEVDAELGHIRLTGVDIDRDRALVARIPPGELDVRAHILLEESTSDVLDIACPDLATAEDLLSRIHR